MTRRARVLRRALVALAVAILAGAVILYLLACRIPSDYCPAHLGREERERATGDFYRRIMDFTSEGEKNQPFTWSVRQAALNAYLGAMDEIASRRGGRPQAVRQMMDRAGLADPAVALDDGVVKLMVRSTQYNKILSAAVRLEIDSEGRLRASLAGAWVGEAPVPTTAVRRHLERIKSSLASRLEAAPAALLTPSTPSTLSTPSTFPAFPVSSAASAFPPSTTPSASSAASRDVGISSEAVAQLLGHVISAIDGKPIPAELTWKYHTKKRVRIEAIEIDDGSLTLRVVPATRPTSGPAADG